MVEVTAHCSRCGEDVGIRSMHVNTGFKLITIKFNCDHIISISPSMRLLTQQEYDEYYPDESERP